MTDRTDRRLMLALALYALGVALWVLANGVRITQEDGFYYLKIAQNIARGAGSTFDGAHPTNGYHPLWLLCLVPLFWLTSSPDIAVHLAVMAQAALTAAGMMLLYGIARLYVGRLAASVAALLWLLLVYEWLFSGLEFSLYALCVLGVMYVYLRWFESRPDGFEPHSASLRRRSTKPVRSTRAYIALGLLLSATFLARTDSIALAGVLGLHLAWRELRARGGGASGRLLAFALPVVLVGITYAIVNLLGFGSAFAVSGAIKHDWAEHLLAQDPRYVAQGWWVAKIYQALSALTDLNSVFRVYLMLGSFGVAALWLVGQFGLRRIQWAAQVRQKVQLLSPFILFSLLNVTGYMLYLHGFLAFAPWYYVMQPVLAVLLVAALLDALPKRAWRSIVMVALVVGIPLYTLRGLSQLGERQRAGIAREPLYVAAQWASANLPADAVIGAWNAGTIGYLSGRRVVNLDGVVNSWDYFRMERFDLCRYWQQERVTFLLDAFEDKEALSAVPTYGAYVRCADRLELVWSANPYGTRWRIAAYRIREP